MVRHAVPSDFAALLRMRLALWPEDTALHEADLAAFFAGQSRHALAQLVAEEGGELVGFAELSIRHYAEDCATDRIAFLEGWYVAPSWRRRGIGRALVAAAEAWGRAQGCTEFASDTQADNQDSAAAHLALGFSDAGAVRCFRKDL